MLFLGDGDFDEFEPRGWTSTMSKQKREFND